jgi:ABC-type multidrug transport system fused ATPase/permease subunit
MRLPRGDGQAPQALPLHQRLQLDGISFVYPGASRPALQHVSLSIAANTTVGIMGPSGAGKTTLVDLILGLLEPDSGTLEIDGTPLTPETVRRWQANLGYVPQSIFLTDDTITRNIAFGLPDERIDREAVERAARAASIDEFVRTELPRGYDTVVGERGVRLSGGQRQRIGIARALYQDPQVLVFDEATSSLDSVTEENVLQAIADLSRTKTILIIAHRLSTVQGCDKIFLLSKGEVVGAGSYGELLGSSTEFSVLAGRSVTA